MSDNNKKKTDIYTLLEDNYPKKNSYKRIAISSGYAMILAIITVSTNNVILSVACVVSATLIYILSEFFFEKNRFNTEVAYWTIVNELKTYHILMSKTIDMLNETSSGINKMSKKIAFERRIDLNIWHFEKSIETVCKIVKSILENSLRGRKEYTINYVMLVEDEHCDKIRTVFSIGNPESNPRNLKDDRMIDDENGFSDAKLFREKINQIKVIHGTDEIDDLLHYSQRKIQKGQYSQLINIPVLCDQKKLTGLIQIFIHSGSSLAIDKEKLLDYANKNFIFLSKLVLLMSKVEKSILSFKLKGDSV